MEISQAIEANVRANYSAQDAGAALDALADMRDPPQAPEWAITRARVQIATLMIARGDVVLLRKAIQQSQIDWRDTLMAAGLGNSDWSHVAKSAGFTLPPAYEP
jgi:hypothetical protein